MQTILGLHYNCIFSWPTLSACYAGDIRLLGGLTAAQGTIQLCVKNEWAAICDQYWSAKDARVVCRQLGFNTSKIVALLTANM